MQCSSLRPHSRTSSWAVHNKIRVWVLPTEQELTSPLLAKLVFKSPQVESGTGLIRVQAEFDNTGARKLETGKRVTMIVYPDANDQK